MVLLVGVLLSRSRWAGRLYYATQAGKHACQARMQAEIYVDGGVRCVGQWLSAEAREQSARARAIGL